MTSYIEFESALYNCNMFVQLIRFLINLILESKNHEFEIFDKKISQFFFKI